ncbi:NAC domain-containing protein 78-like [Cornus florida]|uniref:NAC domain-containing protein 78-like n=1 Tax=Cornus florida TaxID=4283 RepID=UPI0028997EB4|nr:NAC domain-containing protein 78-like [Cornus florida]
MALESTPQTASLAPGFRFHPTDDELIRYYLKRKVCGKPFRFDAISDTDVYKCEPWDLPGKSKLKTRDLEWYFFSILDKKYGNSSRTNRATERGYWKTTGKDRPILHRSRTVGMKKTLVYHSGRAPRGERTNWVMHEYRIVDEELEKAGVLKDAFVLCRIFQKSGTGPKNGERYGAPFVEEEWEDDELVMVPGQQFAGELVVGDDAYLDGTDLEQILDAGVRSQVAPLPVNFDYGDNSNYIEEATEFTDGAQNFLVGMGENHCGLEQPDGQKLFDLPVQYDDMDAKTVKHEYIGESSNTVNPEFVDYLLDEPFLDTTSDLPFEGEFLETNDLSNPIGAYPSGFDTTDTFFDANDDSSQYMAFDCQKMIGTENLLADQAHQMAMTSQQPLMGHDSDVASSSKQEFSEFKSDTRSLFVKQAHHLLGSIYAPPAFASEFPTKNAALLQNHASESSSSVHVTAGMVHVRNTTLSGNGTDWSLSKHRGISIALSFGLSRSNMNSGSLEPMVGVHLGKYGTAMFRGWFYLMFICVLILSMSFKIGTYIRTGNAS